MTDRIRDYFKALPHEEPTLVIDLDVVRQNYLGFARALPDSRIFYAVKANPAPEILSLLASLGSCFDTASLQEIRMAQAAGASAERISFGNTIKRESDIARAYQLGVRLFAFDSDAELEKLARQAPGAKVFCRILCDGEGAEWPLSRKFGCEPRMAERLMLRAAELGLDPYGVSFHVGSQQANTMAWDAALATVGQIFRRLERLGVNLRMVNLGGGFPTRYTKDVPNAERYGFAIRDALSRHFGNRLPETIIEPGRGMVGNAGMIRSEILLISRKSDVETQRWIYLDIGKFGGLAETMDEAIRYPIETPCDGAETEGAILAGPTCDSADVLYEKRPYALPVSLEIGDLLLIGATGAYTSTYSSVAFNGFQPLRTVCI